MIHFMLEFEWRVVIARNQAEPFCLCRLLEVAARGYRSVAAMRHAFLYKVVVDRMVIAYITRQSQNYARLV